MRDTQAKSSFWQYWRVFSLILVALLVLPAARQAYNWYEKSRDAKEKQAARDTTRDVLAKLQAEQNAARDAAKAKLEQTTETEQKLIKEFQDTLQKARKSLEDKDFFVRLTAPTHAQPGAPYTAKLETLNRNGQPIKPKKLEVIIKDAKEQVVEKWTHEKPTDSITTLDLPLAFWTKVKPGTDLFLHVAALTDDDRKGILEEKIPLSRPVFVTHLATDKPLYKPGETIRFRSLTLDRTTLLPPQNDLNLKFRLRDPGDAVTQLDEGNGRLLSNLQPVMGPDGKPLRGIGVGEYAIPAEAAGGEYKLDLYEVESGSRREVLLETRKFLVNRYVPDTFEKKLEFDGKSYGPGDTVQARIEVSRTAGGPMKDAKTNVVATIDGVPFHEVKNASFTIVSGVEKGATKAVLDVRFKIPSDIFDKAKDTPPNATLALNIQDGSDAESIVRPIPLVAKHLRVEFFPEGGEMIDNVSGRVYFMVRTPINKPADLKGYITDGTSTIAEVGTLTDAENPGVNRGHGIFAITPKPGAKYFLKITSPVGITEPTKDGFPLPAAKADGVALTALDAVADKAGAIRVRLQVGKGPKTLHVGAYARGRLIAHHKIDVVEADTPVDVSLKGDDEAGGVTRVTVFEEAKPAAEGRVSLIPRAERLIFRKQNQHLILNVNPDKSRYAPAGKVKLDLCAFNEKEQPTPAVLMVGVVNRSVITMADNKTDRLMPTHFLLSGEVKHPAELEHADFLLTDHPKAAVALDLLLGTQGWRRFAEQNANPANTTPDVEKMLVAHGQKTTAPFALYRLEEERVNAEFRPKLEQAVLARSTAETDWVMRNGSPDAVKQIQEAQTAASNADAEYTKAAAELYPHETRPTHPPSWGLSALALSLCALFVGALTLAASRPSGSRQPYFLATFALFAVSALAIAGTAQTWFTPDTELAWSKTVRDNRMEKQLNAAPEMAAAAVEPRANAFNDAVGNAMPEGAMFDNVGDKKDAPVPALMMPMGPGAPPQPTPPAQKLDVANKEQKQLDDQNKVARQRNRGDRAQEKAKLAAALAKPMAQPVRPGAGPRADGIAAEPQFAAGQPFAREANEKRDPFGGGGFGKDERAAMLMPFVVREYAHERDASLGDVRADFTETVYWHPVLVLPQSGKATVEFQLSDDIARYEVLVAGHTLDGRIGAVTKTIESRMPFSVDPKLPLQVSHTDVIDMPLRVVNDSDDMRKIALSGEFQRLKLDGTMPDSIELGANGKSRKMLRLKADALSGDASVLITGASGAERDNIRRTIQIVPDGFPGVGSISDMLENGRARGSMTLPKDIVVGSLKVRLEMYPTSMADLVKGLDGLLREPCGCFEQTSTSNYPNTLILDYMNQTNQTNPEAAKRAKSLLDRGYSKLISFECPDTPEKTKQGFEWFGQADNQHEALTAYGLLQFKDMARVHTVDPQLIKRTQSYLMSRRDGQGGFKRNARALDQFGGAPKHTTDAYIVWALVESDPDDAEKLDLTKEIQSLKTEAMNDGSVGGKDAYFVALTANVLLLRGDRQAAHQLLDRLKEKHAKNGAITGAVTSITRSGGRDLEIETTALSLLGWMRANDPKYSPAIKEATKWISQQRGGYGGFGSTQSTILALKALTLYAKKSAHPSESGELKLLVGGKVVGTRKFTEKDVEVIGIDIADAEAIFKPGVATEVEVVTDAKQPYPFAVSYTYTTLTPVSAEKCAVKISTKLAKTEANEGDTVPLSVTMENKEGQGMAVAIIGIPAGMKVPTDMKQLTDLREKGQISYFETRDRELILYWRQLPPNKSSEFTVDLVCDVPGKYRGPASRAYLYYNADHKHWVAPLAMTIAPMTDEKAK